jgi:hypothetical protein
MVLSEGKEDFAHLFERRFGKQLQLRLKVLQDVPELTA